MAREPKIPKRTEQEKRYAEAMGEQKLERQKAEADRYRCCGARKFDGHRRNCTKSRLR